MTNAVDVKVAEQYLRDRAERARAKAEKNPGEWVERDRVLAVVKNWIDRFERQTFGASYRVMSEDERKKAGAREALAEAMGVNVRTLWRLTADEPSVFVRAARDGRGSFVTAEGCEPYLSAAYLDRLLVAIDRPDLWHIPAADGGFLDVFEAGCGDVIEVDFGRRDLEVAA